MTPRAARLHPEDGTWLLAADLRDAPRLPALRLARHQIAAHRTWGCSSGLEVFCDGERILVMRGCGIDRCGRTLVLARTHRGRFDPPREVVVALTAVGDGPAARVVLRSPDAVGDSDLPLARVAANGMVLTGDGGRQWLRRPGPVRIVSGVVPRGALASGHATSWRTTVDLAAEQLAEPPFVVASAAGPTPVAAAAANGAAPVPVVGTLISVGSVSAASFEIAVIHHLPASGPIPPVAAVSTTSFPLAWLAVLPAARPEFPPEEWS